MVLGNASQHSHTHSHSLRLQPDTTRMPQIHLACFHALAKYFNYSEDRNRTQSVIAMINLPLSFGNRHIDTPSAFVLLHPPAIHRFPPPFLFSFTSMTNLMGPMDAKCVQIYTHSSLLKYSGTVHPTSLAYHWSLIPNKTTEPGLYNVTSRLFLWPSIGEILIFKDSPKSLILALCTCITLDGITCEPVIGEIRHAHHYKLQTLSFPTTPSSLHIITLIYHVKTRDQIFAIIIYIMTWQIFTSPILIIQLSVNA